MTAAATPSPAARAWAMLTDPTDPMPPQAAVDWLRQEMDTDDVAAVKRALYGAAADEVNARHVRLAGTHRPDDGTGTGGTAAHIRRAEFDAALDRTAWLDDNPGQWTKTYVVWRGELKRILALCRQIEAL